jgi:hypothetical protein
MSGFLVHPPCFDAGQLPGLAEKDFKNQDCYSDNNQQIQLSILKFLKETAVSPLNVPLSIFKTLF